MMSRRSDPDYTRDSEQASEQRPEQVAMARPEAPVEMTAGTIMVALFLAVAGLFSGCGGDEPPSERLNTEFEAEGVLDFYRPDSSLVTRIVLELAESDAEQAQGLMYRTSLPGRGGMLFIDDRPSMQSFWMRNTPLPLDILFIDSRGEIVNIVKRTTPYSDDRIESTDSAQYVLEVRAGFTDRYSITDSMHVDWERRNLSQDESS